MSDIKLKQITIYPIKSIAGIDLTDSLVETSGLAFDRRFVLADLKGQFITARTENKLCLIHSKLTAEGLQLNAPGMRELILRYDDFSSKYQSVKVWGDHINAQYCADQYDEWFSRFIGKACRLYYFGTQSLRKTGDIVNEVSFADGYPLLLISQASLDDLNSRTQSVIKMHRFRPNIVVEHCAPFAEDGWKHIRLGEVEFIVHSPCARCIMTTINPLTSELHQQREPLATLQKYRKDDKAEVYFGQNLIPLNQGRLRLGDKLTVLESQSPQVYINNAPLINSRQLHQVPAKSFTLRCSRVIQQTADVKTFEFEPYESRELTYIAGQHITIELLIGGKRVHRCYTLSSSPTRPERLAITVKQVEGGLVSNYLHQHFTQGWILTSHGIGGNFHLQNGDTDRVLLLSAGSGVTPMLSMLRTMSDQRLNNDIVYFHSAKSAEDIVAREEVEALAKQHGNCQVIYTLTRSDTPVPGGYVGHLNRDMLENIRDLTQREVYVCGPMSFRDTTRELLFALGLPASQYHFELFASPQDPLDLVTNAPQTPPLNVEIEFSSWGTTYQGNNQSTLLEQAEQAGLSLPYSCRAGMCGTCKVKLERGEVTSLADMGGLSDQDKQAGFVLACNCIPLTNLSLSAGE